MLPYNLAGNLHTERILHVPAAPALTSSHSLEGTKSYHPQPGRIHPGSTASDPGKGSEEKAAEGVCFRLDPITGRVISPAGVAPDLHCRLCPHTALLAADVAQSCPYWRAAWRLSRSEVSQDFVPEGVRAGSNGSAEDSVLPAEQEPTGKCGEQRVCFSCSLSFPLIFVQGINTLPPSVLLPMSLQTFRTTSLLLPFSSPPFLWSTCKCSLRLMVPTHPGGIPIQHKVRDQALQTLVVAELPVPTSWSFRV